METNPDYHHIGDHTETVQVDYDPQRLTYSQLLDVFWKSHNPASQPWSRQYMHVVFYHDAQQEALALQSLAAVEKKKGAGVKTKILPIRSFTLAEDYHQKYLLKQQMNLKNEMRRIYPRHRELVASTAVARLNGYVGGYGSDEQLSAEIDRLGLGEAGKRILADIVRRQSDYDRD